MNGVSWVLIIWLIETCFVWVYVRHLEAKNAELKKIADEEKRMAKNISVEAVRKKWIKRYQKIVWIDFGKGDEELWKEVEANQKIIAQNEEAVKMFIAGCDKKINQIVEEKD